MKENTNSGPSVKKDSRHYGENRQLQWTIPASEFFRREHCFPLLLKNAAEPLLESADDNNGAHVCQQFTAVAAWVGLLWLHLEVLKKDNRHDGEN